MCVVMALCKELGCLQLLALEDGVKNWPWHQAGCYQGFARRNQQHFWELFISTRWEVPVKALCCVLLSGAEY